LPTGIPQSEVSIAPFAPDVKPFLERLRPSWELPLSSGGHFLLRRELFFREPFADDREEG
jgi:hypothetical protein